jgi:hypothetical protein
MVTYIESRLGWQTGIWMALWINAVAAVGTAAQPDCCPPRSGPLRSFAGF